MEKSKELEFDADMMSPAMGNDAASRRLLKKREIDRRSQRISREKKKNRIAYLEKLVENFTNEDSTGQVTDLMKQLQEVAEERDGLVRTLANIQNSLRVHTPLIQKLNALTTKTPSFIDESSTVKDNEKTPIAQMNQSAVSDLCTQLDDPNWYTTLQDTTGFPSNPSLRNDASSGFSSHNTLAVPSTNIQSMAAEWYAMTGVTEGTSLNSILKETICNCGLYHADKRKAPFNFWRFANETLIRPTELSEDLNHLEDAMADDTPIRAITEGWASVERRIGGKLPPSWQKLKQIDQVLFSSCGNTERLAIMRMMHLLLRSHTDPTPERNLKLPLWYHRRPSQGMAHSYAIDYFAWPGIRERFVFHEHKYCINDFWYLFVANLRIMWPYEFRDTYSRNTTTGQYKISPDFEERIGDINVWTMSTDFFNRWPELHCDIPAFNSIPGPIVSTPRSTTLAIKAPTKTSRETAEVQEEDVYQSATFLPDEFDLLTSTYVFP